MQKALRHIIQKQILQLGIDREQDHHELSGQLRNIFQQKVLPALSDVFDRLAPDRHLRIDKLEIELPPLSKSDWKEQFADLLVKNIEQEIRSQLPVDWWVKDSDEGVGAGPKSAKGQLLEAFLHFCRSGHFPWWFDASNFQKFEEKLLEVPAAKLLATLQKMHLEPSSLERLSLQFSDTFFEKMEKKLAVFTGLSGQLNHWLELLQKGGLAEKSQKVLQRIIRLSWLSVVPPSGEQVSIDEQTFVTRLIQETAKITKNNRTDIALQLLKALQFVQLNTEAKTNLRKQIERAIDKEYLSAVDLPKKSLPEPKSGAFLNELNPSDSSSLEATPPVEKLGAYYIDNAGLVLLWPYISRFFESLQLLEKGDFKDESAREQAILILQYLKDGGHCWQEHLLPLNKLLCGKPLYESLGCELVLTDDIKEQSEQLLSAVVRNWPQLKGTSVAGLQQSFLQREGKLEEKENHWKLTVSRQSFDLLLDHLPWSFKMIKLSWMEKMIQVEW